MLKKAVSKKRLALSAQTVRTLTVIELDQVNGGRRQPAVSVQSSPQDACSSTQ